MELVALERKAPSVRMELVALAPKTNAEAMARQRAEESQRRTTSPSGRLHDNAERRADLRLADPWSDVSFYASSRQALSQPGAARTGGFEQGKAGGPSGDLSEFSARQTTTQGWISVQAWLESLRYYPAAGVRGKRDSTPRSTHRTLRRRAASTYCSLHGLLACVLLVCAVGCRKGRRSFD